MLKFIYLLLSFAILLSVSGCTAVDHKGGSKPEDKAIVESDLSVNQASQSQKNPSTALSPEVNSSELAEPLPKKNYQQAVKTDKNEAKSVDKKPVVDKAKPKPLLKDKKSVAISAPIKKQKADKKNKVKAVAKSDKNKNEGKGESKKENKIEMQGVIQAGPDYIANKNISNEKLLKKSNNKGLALPEKITQTEAELPSKVRVEVEDNRGAETPSIDGGLNSIEVDTNIALPGTVAVNEGPREILIVEAGQVNDQSLAASELKAEAETEIKVKAEAEIEAVNVVELNLLETELEEALIPIDDGDQLNQPGNESVLPPEVIVTKDSLVESDNIVDDIDSKENIVTENKGINSTGAGEGKNIKEEGVKKESLKEGGIEKESIEKESTATPSAVEIASLDDEIEKNISVNNIENSSSVENLDAVGEFDKTGVDNNEEATYIIIKQDDAVQKVPAVKTEVDQLLSSLASVLALDWGMLTPNESQSKDHRFHYCYRVLAEMRKDNYRVLPPYNVSPLDYNRWQQRLGQISLVQLADRSLNFYYAKNSLGKDFYMVETIFSTDAELSKMLLGVQENNYYFSGVVAFGENSQQSLGGAGRFHSRSNSLNTVWYLFEWNRQYYALRLKEEGTSFSELEIIPLFYQQQKRQRNCRWLNQELLKSDFSGVK